MLRSLFADKVTEPTACVVSRWGADPFSRGSYSFVAVGASGKDYDVLAAPVAKRLLFAGEHTCKEHPDTVGGAMITVGGPCCLPASGPPPRLLEGLYKVL